MNLCFWVVGETENKICTVCDLSGNVPDVCYYITEKTPFLTEVWVGQPRISIYIDLSILYPEWNNRQHDYVNAPVLRQLFVLSVIGQKCFNGK